MIEFNTKTIDDNNNRVVSCSVGDKRDSIKDDSFVVGENLTLRLDGAVILSDVALFNLKKQLGLI